MSDIVSNHLSFHPVMSSESPCRSPHRFPPPSDLTTNSVPMSSHQRPASGTQTSQVAGLHPSRVPAPSTARLQVIPSGPIRVSVLAHPTSGYTLEEVDLPQALLGAIGPLAGYVARSVSSTGPDQVGAGCHQSIRAHSYRLDGRGQTWDNNALQATTSSIHAAIAAIAEQQQADKEEAHRQRQADKDAANRRLEQLKADKDERERQLEQLKADKDEHERYLVRHATSAVVDKVRVSSRPERPVIWASWP
jgi:hypothetical protein